MTFMKFFDVYQINLTLTRDTPPIIGQLYSKPLLFNQGTIDSTLTEGNEAAPFPVKIQDQLRPHYPIAKRVICTSDKPPGDG